MPRPAGLVLQAPAQTATARTADQSSACAQVSHLSTVVIDGVQLSPPRAYAVASYLPNSAP